MATIKDSTKVITNKVRLSYPNLFQPKSFDGGEAKYGAALLIPKSDTETVKLIQEAMQNALVAKFGAKVPVKPKLALRDGDEERPEDENYKGMWFLNANSKNQPGMLNALKPVMVDGKAKPTPITDPTEIYAGCWVIAAINFFGFETKGNKGVGAGLNNLMLVAHGERLAGAASAASDFGDIDVSAFVPVDDDAL